MNHADLKRLIVGPIAAVPTAFNADYSLDLGRMAELTEWWIQQGITTGRSVLKVTAAIGEGPDLGDDEWPKVVDAVVRQANGRVPVIAGLRSTGTYRSIADVKTAASLGAIGVQVDLPMFHHPTQDDYVRYFTDLSDASEIGILIYNTWWFGAASITANTMLKLADAENVVAIKWSVPPDGSIDFDDMRRFADRFNVIDNTGQWVRSHKNGGVGHISYTVFIDPKGDLHIWDLLQQRRYDEAQAAFDRIYVPLRKVLANVSAKSGGYQAAKALLDLIGKSAGPIRPPSLPVEEPELSELRELVREFGWDVAAEAPLSLAH